MSITSGWLPTAAGGVWAALHVPEGPGTGTVVVFAPPFGWEAMSAGRQLRGWAARLAAEGHAAVRYHPPGTGDSDGRSTDPDLDDWVAGLTDVVKHAQDLSGCTRVTVVGLGLGGLTALRAVDGGAPVDDLVLWSVPSKGRLLLREVKAFAALTAGIGDSGPDDLGPTESDSDGFLWSHGYPLSPGAQEQLAALDVAQLDLGRLQRALVLGRGALPHDSRLVAALESAGVQTDAAPGAGYDDLTVEPRLARPPVETERLVGGWLLPGELREPRPWPASGSPQREVRVGPVSAVVTGDGDPRRTVVFVGAGATPRSGPNRLWTDAALRWAERGVTSYRLDLSGIGEAEGVETWHTGPEGLYVERYRDEIRAVLETVPSEELLAVGLCSGGFWAAQAALDEKRIAAVCLLNPATLVWPPPLQRLGARGRWKDLTSKKTWDQLLHDAESRRDHLRRVGRTVALRWAALVGRDGDTAVGRPTTTRQAVHALDRLGTRVTIGLSPGEPLLDEVDAAVVGTGVRVVRLDGPAGAHTLAPPALRRAAEALVDEAVESALRR